MRITSELKLIFCICGIYLCYLSYGFFQEWIYSYRDPNGVAFRATLFLLLVQCVVNTIFTFPGLLFYRCSFKNMPKVKVLTMGVCYILAMLFSNESLKFVNYPTQALGKSCKMIPVMLFSFLFGKRYHWSQYVCVLLITLGITTFSLFGSNSKKVQESNSLYGIFLMFLSLVMDGITGSTQDMIQNRFQFPSTVMMFSCNFVAILILLPANLAYGQLFNGFTFCEENPEIRWFIFLFSVSSALGQLFIFYTITSFDALMCATITTTRKFFTILVSVILFGHHITASQWLGVGMVFGGLGGELLHKYLNKNKKKRNK